MTAYEKFMIGLIALWALAHMVRIWGAQAGLSTSAVSMAESWVTRW